MPEPDDRPRVLSAEQTSLAEALFSTPELPELPPIVAATNSALSATRASRLRRIVRNGEEIVRRLARMSEDLHREVPEAYHTMERGSDRAADLLSDIRDAFDRTAFFAKGQAKQAADRLMQADQPVRFTRPRKTEAAPEAGEGSQPPPLWKLFASGQGDALDEEADRPPDHEDREGERPPWTDL